MSALTKKSILTVQRLTLALALVAACLAAPARAQVGQVSEAVRAANLQRVLAPRPANVSQSEHLKSIDRFVLSLPKDQSYALEMDTWGILFKQQKITPLEFARNMAATTAKFSPDDAIAKDYWAYAVRIAAQAEAGEITREQYDVLADRKFREATAQHDVVRRREQAMPDAQKKSPESQRR